METDRGVGRSRCRKRLKEADRSGQKWSEMRILDFIFQQEYLLLPLRGPHEVKPSGELEHALQVQVLQLLEHTEVTQRPRDVAALREVEDDELW